MKAVGQRDMGIQEVMHQLLSVKFVSSSFQVINPSLLGLWKITVETIHLKQNHPFLTCLQVERWMNVIFLAYQHWILYNLHLTSARVNMVCNARKLSIEIKTYPSYPSNPKRPSYDLFCKNQLLKHKPWHTFMNNSWGDQDGSDSVYIQE